MLASMLMLRCHPSHFLPLQTVLDRALAFEVLPERFEVVKEKKAKDFANMK